MNQHVFKRTFFLVLLLAAGFFVRAQQGFYMSPDIWQNMHKVVLEKPLSFVDYAYDSPFLDLRDFQLRNPQVSGRIPEYVEVTPPANVKFSDLYYSVAYISSADGKSGVLVLLFIEDYNGPQPNLWIDANLNRDFRDDGEPVRFVKSRQKVDIVLKHSDENAIGFHFSIVGPEIGPEGQLKPVKEPKDLEAVASTKGNKGRGIPHWLSFNFDVGYALGRVTYSYQNLATGYPVNYRVSSNHKGFRAGLGLHLGNFRISPTVGFNHFFYWTSYKVVRLGEPYVFCDPSCTRFENVEELRNKDLHPDIRWDFGMQLAWEPFLSKDVRFGPFVEPQLWVFSDGNYYEKVLTEYVAFPMRRTAALRTGVALWVKAEGQSYFRVEFSAAWSHFQPEGFFDGFNLLDDQQRSLGLNLGYGF